MGWFY